MRTAIFSGSFDPFTNGHLDVLTKGVRLFDVVIVAVGTHPTKAGLFTVEERVGLVRQVVAERLAGADVRVETFAGLLVEEAVRHDAAAILRGLRDGTDLDYEMQMAAMNGVMRPGVETVFVPASPAERPITATLVRQIAQMGGDVSPFVPEAVAAALDAKFSRSPFPTGARP